ncbi:MAG: peptidoglycan editing factor PgeF [Lachnospiraceae bacterium]|nr:peptidoglycan editing factor PgeF [Lachnospiraceae bacterium]
MKDIIRKKHEGEGIPVINKLQETEYLTFPGLDATGLVNHLFSTRKGGVSTGIYESMNLSYSRGDDKALVDENYRRIASVFGETMDKIVLSDQTHTTNIRLVTKEDCGKGITGCKDYQDVDGMITNEPGIILATLYADCVPLYFVDTKNKAIGLSHSGWKGTVGRIGKATLDAMKEAFGTNPVDVHCAIGPSICKDCYEVSGDVALQFKREFAKQAEQIVTPISPVIEMGKEQEQLQEDKYLLDLWQANKIVLMEAGVLKENIEVTDLCTCCNSSYLFSHRASKGKRGNLGAFLELRNN